MRLPISVFFMSYSLSLWVPRGGGCGEWPPPVLGAGLHSSGSKRKAWGHSPPSGAESYEMRRGSSLPWREGSSLEGRGTEARG